MHRRWLLGALGAAAARPALAADWPSQPVRLQVAFPPGASTDVLARAMAPVLGAALGQPVVVENRPGAGGNLATQQVMRAAPDGHTLLLHSVAYAVNPSLYRNAGYDAVADLEPVALLASTPNILTANPEKVQATTLQALLSEARARPMEYGSSGTGTTTHLGAELLFNALAKTPVLHVAFGPAQAITAVVGGQVPIASTSMPPALPMIREGRLRPIAVMSLRRDPALPNVPTVAESGFPGFEALTWFAMLAPRGTPPAVLDRLNAEVAKALATPEVAARLQNLAFQPTPMPRAEVATYIRDEVAKWAAVVRSSGATAE